VIPTQPDRNAEIPRSCTLVELGAIPGDNQKGESAGWRYKLLVTPEEAAAILSVGRTTVYEFIATGQLESVQIKSCRRIPMAALQRFVQRLLEGSERAGPNGEGGSSSEGAGRALRCSRSTAP
jgi:excisionase family DNA binding protein